jgi:Flp pilus assembly pilin Flp
MDFILRADSFWRHWTTGGTIMKKTLKTLWQDESAQGATEYILMLVIVVGIAMLFKNQITGIIKGKVSELGDSIQSFNSSGN